MFCCLVFKWDVFLPQGCNGLGKNGGVFLALGGLRHALLFGLFCMFSVVICILSVFRSNKMVLGLGLMWGLMALMPKDREIVGNQGPETATTMLSVP